MFKEFVFIVLFNESNGCFMFVVIIFQKRLLHMERELTKRVVGQPDAVKIVSDCVRLSRAGLRSHDRPLGVFLFLGPTGVGKTELTKVCDMIYH